jgi:dTDP-4-dehydrorhamnose 3,5-epimerase
MLTTQGVIVTRLQPHNDERGSFIELFRKSWLTNISPVQWNIVHSNANVMRGFHAHVDHYDYLMCAAGSLLLGIKDIRPGSLSEGHAELILLKAEEYLAVTIPPGVAHGFYFARPSTHIYAVSEYWNRDDELGCRWDDPQIGLNWPCATPELSERDREAGSFAAMVDAFRERCAHGS